MHYLNAAKDAKFDLNGLIAENASLRQIELFKTCDTQTSQEFDTEMCLERLKVQFCRRGSVVLLTVSKSTVKDSQNPPFFISACNLSSVSFLSQLDLIGSSRIDGF